jgi:hypothetical protein
MQYQLGGVIASSSTSQSPEFIAIRCALISPAQGLPGERPTLTAEFEAECPGSMCAGANTVTDWPVRPVVICISGYARFGPVPFVEKYIQPACA